jgi:hypothetical protein
MQRSTKARMPDSCLFASAWAGECAPFGGLRTGQAYAPNGEKGAILRREGLALYPMSSNGHGLVTRVP